MSHDQLPLTSTHWGTYHVEVTDGKLEALHAFGEDPDPSPIGHGLVDVLDGPTRIRQPMIRKSWLDHGPGACPHLRGKDPFVPVDWGRAEGLVAQELERVRTAHGNSAIYGGSYGWASAGRFHHAQSQVHRFLNCIGGYTRSLNTYSFAAAEVAVPHILGGFREFVNSVTSWSSIIGNTELFVAFGGIPTKNGQIENGGVGQHGQFSSVVLAAESGTSFVNISPNRSSLPCEANAEWLAPRPCSDVAVLLGIAHVLVDEGLADHAFLDRYTVGFDAVSDYLKGHKDGIVKSARWAAGISGLSEDDIRTLAIRMASARTMISVSWSLTRQQYGEQPYWAAITVAAMLGQIGQPGGGIGFGYSATNGIGAQYQRLNYASLPQGENAVSDFIPVARIADMLMNPNGMFDYNGGKHIYPDIRLIYWAGGNPFHHHQDLGRLLQAWRKPDTIIAHEWCWTATARHCDIVLPCTTHVERNDIALSPRNAYVVAMQKAVEPVGLARNDYAIFTGIARAMGVEKAFTQGRSEEDWLQWIFDGSRHNLAQSGLAIPPLDTLRERGWFKIAMEDRPTIMMEAFIKDPDAAPLATPSGKIELYSDTVAGFEYSDCPGHAVWLEPEEWLGAKNVGSQLHLICVQPANKLHSQLDHGAHSQKDKVAGREKIRLSPADAHKRGIVQGAHVRVFNARGSCLAIADIDTALRADVVEMNTGAWFDPALLDDERPMCKAGNPNVLTPDKGTSAMAQGPAAHTCLVDVELMPDEPETATAYEPPKLYAD